MLQQENLYTQYLSDWLVHQEEEGEDEKERS